MYAQFAGAPQFHVKGGAKAVLRSTINCGSACCTGEAVAAEADAPILAATPTTAAIDMMTRLFLSIE
jgi:hypothetical protein